MKQGAGLHVILEFVDQFLNKKDLISRAREENDRLFPSSDTYQCSNNHPIQIMLSFGRINSDELEKGIKILSRAWNL